jgi:hypothetical protein
MLTLLTATYLYLNNPLLDKPKPKPAIVQHTVTEADNPQHCDESLYWIASESPYYCIPKTNLSTPSTWAGDSSGNLYSYGNCTFWVKQNRPDLPNNLGNASDWYYSAQADGLATGSDPRINAVAWFPSGGLGHVALVKAIYSDGTILISEMNHEGFNIVDERLIIASSVLYIY